MKNAIRSLIALMHEVDPSSCFEVRLWDDERIVVGQGDPRFRVWIRTERALARILGDGFLGFGESYMDKEIEIEGDFRHLLCLGHQGDFGSKPLTLMEKVRFILLFLRNRNTLGRASRNIAHHYNLGNDFYQLFLDETLAYTCAYFRTPQDTLEQAQINKYDHVCRKLRLREGERLVDLGCGWGGLLIHAAREYGIEGVGVTLSEPQYDYANRRIEELGLERRIRVLLCDYREVEGRFDKLASVGMLEHVGKNFIPTCTRKVSELLEPRGLGLIHFIGNDTPFPDDPWTMKYMFPGSHVPALEQVIHDLARYRLTILDVENLRPHYARTIDCWLERFESHFEEICERFDERFARQWRLYFLVSSTSFSHGGNRLFQVLFSNGLNNDLPLTRESLYRD